MAAAMDISAFPRAKSFSAASRSIWMRMVRAPHRPPRRTNLGRQVFQFALPARHQGNPDETTETFHDLDRGAHDGVGFFLSVARSRRAAIGGWKKPIGI